MANAIRSLSMDGVEKAKSGHPGLPMGAADIATVLFTRFLKFDPADPAWPDRDRFILSAGHGSMLLYALLYLTGTKGMALDDLKNFRQMGSKTPGHPEFGHTQGVEVTTGPLGQGLATSVGFALGERIMAATFSDDLVDHHTYVLASDGDLMEGISQEAIALAGHLKLSRLVVLWDDNGISIDGPLSIADSVDQLKRFESAGWNATRVDGHDHDAIAAAITAAQSSDRPTLIACKTIIGYGAPKRAGTSKAHGEPLGAEELAGAKAALGLSPEPFDVPADVLHAWRDLGKRSQPMHAAWLKRLAASAHRAEFERRIAGKLPAGFDQAIAELKSRLAAEPQTLATRKSSELALETITAAVPELILGSADLTPSNNTKTKNLVAISPGNFAGRYIHFGIREHGMAACMNGMALHGGLIPSGATFMVFTDYCRPAIRLSALMGLRAIYVMTHDSIGLGEDGPTHQPVEHLAALRCMPNVNVFRPADAVEAAECWELALKSATTPSVLALTRQNLPQIRSGKESGNLSALGAYELGPAEGTARVSLFASGSEIEIAVAARTMLAARGIAARIVSVPSLELFAKQDDAYRAKVIGTASVKIGIEAAVGMGWDRLIGSDGIFVGMTGFGASAPYKELYAHFGITAEAVVQKALARLG
jgi:transketolase